MCCNKINFITARPGAVEIVKPVTEHLSAGFKIFAFTLLGLKAGYTYEITIIPPVSEQFPTN